MLKKFFASRLGPLRQVCQVQEHLYNAVVHASRCYTLQESVNVIDLGLLGGEISRVRVLAAYNAQFPGVKLLGSFR